MEEITLVNSTYLDYSKQKCLCQKAENYELLMKRTNGEQQRKRQS
jgi:hypothetical protein